LLKRPSPRSRRWSSTRLTACPIPNSPMWAPPPARLVLTAGESTTTGGTDSTGPPRGEADARDWRAPAAVKRARGDPSYGEARSRAEVRSIRPGGDCDGVGSGAKPESPGVPRRADVVHGQPGDRRGARRARAGADGGDAGVRRAGRGHSA